MAALAARSQSERLHSFSHLSKEAGLVSNQVNSILQDSTGYIWIATNDGLARFDGVRSKNLHHVEGNASTIPPGKIIQLISDQQHRIWLLSSEGRAGILDVAHFTFHEVPVRPRNLLSLKSSDKKLVLAHDGLLLLLGEMELLALDRQQVFRPAAGLLTDMNNRKIVDLAEEPGGGAYWFADADSGFITIPGPPSSGRRAFHPSTTALPPAPGIHCLFFDSKGRMWYSTQEGGNSYISCFNFRENRFLISRMSFSNAIRGFHQVSGFAEQQDGTIWIFGFKIFGRYREHEREFELIPSGSVHEKSIDYRVVTALCEDREHNLWVGTGNNGIFRFNPSQEFFHNIGHVSRQTGLAGDGSPLSFFRDADGTLLAGIWNDGLYRYDSTFHTIPLRIRNIPEANQLNVYDMRSAPDGKTVWLASDGALLRYSPSARTAMAIPIPSLRGQVIRQVIEDMHGNLWLGASSGLYLWRNRGVSPSPILFDAIPSGLIQSLATDRSGRLWVATASSGMYVVNTDSLTTFMRFFSGADGVYRIPQDDVVSVQPYDDSAMLVATSDQLFFWNQFRHQLTPLLRRGTLAGDIASVRQDEQHRLWVGTTESLCRVTPSSNVMLTFDRSDGIINDYFMPNAACALPGNRLVFGTSGHILTFNADRVRLTAARPNITVTGFRVLNRPLSVDSLMRLRQISLAPGDNSLTIDFSTLTFNSNYVITYQLEGLDEQQKTADATSQLVYSYLPPGNYKLRFHTLNAEGYENTNALTLLIRINPPFWRTWWFFSAVFLLLVGCVYWLDRQRTRALWKQQQMRVSIAANLHEEVNTTLRSINVLSEIAAMKSGSQPEQARDYLKDIQSKSRRMVIAMDDMLWSIDPRNDSMARTTERMKEIAAAIASGSDAKITVQSSRGSSKLGLDMKTRLDLISVFKLLLELLVRKAGAGETNVYLDCDRRLVLLKLVSKNVRLDRHDVEMTRTLAEIEAKVKEMGAVLHLDSDNRSTDFVVELPT